MGQTSFTELAKEHLEAVKEIYNYYVANTTVSFHTELQSIQEIKASVMNSDPRFKSYAIIAQNTIAGYVLVTQHKKKQAYDISGELTIYLHPDYVGRGIGGQAVQFIEGVAAVNGFHSLVATICGENKQSQHLFVKNGFVQCAHYKEIGMKFGKRLDIYVYQKIIS